MDNTVTLVGLDFGTTTSCAAIASATLACNPVTRRMELNNVEPRFYSEPVFTPFRRDELDEPRLAGYLHQWLKGIESSEVFGGGVMITGLAAQAANAAAVARLARRYLKDAIVAVAADPSLESWLAFMGNCWELSRASSNRTFVNFDIGGGTTNIAMGRNGEVVRTGSFFVGARHVQFEPGGYRITALSSYARPLLDHLGIQKSIGDQLAESEVRAIVDWYLNLLESVAGGRFPTEAGPTEVDSLTALHRQVPFDSFPDAADVAVTLSGGVGQLAYRGLKDGTWPGTTAYGDLGVDLAQRLVQRPIWRERLTQYVPTGLGRATLFGLLRYNTQVSGSTLYLSDRQILPLSDLIIVGSVSPDIEEAEMDRLIALAARTSNGACLRIDAVTNDHGSIRRLAQKLTSAIARQSAFQHIPLVLLVRENVGKVLGQFVTSWGASPAKVVVIDEIDARDAQFAWIGRLQKGVVPVSFYEMNASGENV